MSTLHRVLLIAILLTAGCAGPRPQPFTLRVLSYNIHHGEGTDGRLDLERIARVIRESGADLAALQEVDRGAPRTGGVDQPATLARLTGMTAVFEKNLDLDGGAYGNAILSRFPVESHRNHFLPNIAPNEQRGLLEASVRVAGRSVLFLATHLDHQQDDAERRACATYIRRLVAERHDCDVILAGDFNMTPDNPVMADFFSFLLDTCPPAPPRPLSFPAGKPDRRIDYLLHNSRAGFRAIDCRILPEPTASDHRPVLATFELAPQCDQGREQACGVATRPATTSTGRITIDRVAPVTDPALPAGLERVDYTSTADGFKDWALVLPSREPTWIVMIHGHGSTGDQLFTRPDIRDTWLPLFRAGHGILTVNLRGNAWMSPDAAADLHALLGEIRARYQPRRFIFASGSMGGTSNLIYAVLHPEDVAGVVALCPATDLATYHQWTVEHQATPIIDEIRRTIEADYAGVPAERAAVYHAHSALAQHASLTMPVYVAHGSADSIIPVTQSRALAEAIGSRVNFRYVELEGGEHDAPHARMQEALQWVTDRLEP